MPKRLPVGLKFYLIDLLIGPCGEYALIVQIRSRSSTAKGFHLATLMVRAVAR